MTTLVGTQKDFAQAIIALIELEYDAIEAYKLAIKALENIQFKNTLSEFLNDHENHVDSIKKFYATSNLDLPSSPDLIKGAMAKMKVKFGEMTGSDINILKAMLSNELDTNTAYSRMVDHDEQPDGLYEILQKGLIDERKHKAWIENIIEHNNIT